MAGTRQAPSHRASLRLYQYEKSYPQQTFLVIMRRAGPACVLFLRQVTGQTRSAVMTRSPLADPAGLL